MAGAVTTFLDEELLWQKAKSGGSPILTLGAIRPDAEVFKEWKRDSLLVHDDGITIPAYSTDKITLEDFGAYFTDTVLLSGALTEYDYFVVYRCVLYPIYTIDTFAGGREEYQFRFQFNEFRLHEVCPPLSGDLDKAVIYNGTYSNAMDSMIVFVSPTSNKLSAANATLGVGYSTGYTIPISITSGDVYATIKSLSISMCGNSTYLAQQFWEAITDIRAQHIIQIWRAPKNNLNLDGWSKIQLEQNIIDCVTSPTHKLV